MKLFNPGPVNLTDTVRQALTEPDLCHREQEFTSLCCEINQKLLNVYDLSETCWSNVLLSGSGTLAVEAMLSSLIPQAGKVLVIVNGVYGERMQQMVRCHSIAYRSLVFAWGQAVDMKLVQQEIAQDTELTHIAVVHHETTTGRLNCLTELADLAKARGLSLLVDAVSSFAAEHIPFEHPALAAVVASANKCLHGAAGVSFVQARQTVLQQSCSPPRSVYLDLQQYYLAQQQNTVPFTPAIPIFYALNQALDELNQIGGWECRHQEYKCKADYLAEKLIQTGIKPLLPLSDSSVVLRAFILPEQLRYQSMHAILRQQGMVIYAGQGRLADKIFRLSTMGQISLADIDKLAAIIARLTNTGSTVSEQELS